MLNDRRLKIYLNDHLAGSIVGSELARRALSENQGNEYGRFLSQLLHEIEADRETLKDVMVRLGIPQARVKQALAWCVEKVGRLKLNGQLMGYSPLSRVIELEVLTLGVAGKRALWRALQLVSVGDVRLASTDFSALVERAEAQLEELERHRVRAAGAAFLGLPELPPA
jgi:hypothetical protein